MSDTSSTFRFDLRKNDFGDDFVWGVSTAAYQIEGAHNFDDKGESIWDRFTTKKGAIFQGQHGQIACDFHSRYREDILMMKALKIPNFRFSISWSRLLPNGQGPISQAGLDFYNKVIDFCLECGITPWITLYHWDLPQALQDQGGWTNRDILSWFGNYVRLCTRHFGDRIQHWIILNEPMVFTGAGYFLGVHAPGHKGLKNFLPAVHHAALCQAIGGRIVRSELHYANIGTTFSCSHITPFSNRKKDVLASQKADALLNRLFIEPSLGLGYPSENIKILERIERYQRPEDEKNLIFEFDFIGIQNYTREVVKHSYTVPYLQSKIVKATQRKVRTTLMDWEIYPPSIYEMISKFNAYPNIKKIIITENGAAFEDNVTQGAIHDHERRLFLQAYLLQVHRAKMEGMEVSGYFAWTFTDNFEWAEGYFPRFGLVYVDFQDQRRIVKASGRWYSEFLKS